MHIVLTGASSGIGRELAVILNSAGHALSVCGRNAEKLSSTVDVLNRDYPIYSLAFCVSDFDAVAHFMHKANETIGHVDVLINCAGLNSGRAMGHELENDVLAWMMTVNCYAPIEFMKAALPTMQTAKSGTIVNVLSTTSLFSNPGIAGYSASKAALDSYTKVMRKELREDGIKMLSVYPGGVDSDFREASRPQYLAPNDVAQAIVSLLNTSANAHIHELVIRPTCEENFA